MKGIYSCKYILQLSSKCTKQTIMFSLKECIINTVQPNAFLLLGMIK